MELRQGTIISVADLPYVSHVPTDGRLTPREPFYDCSTGKTWVFVVKPDNKLLVLPVLSIAQGLYFAQSPFKESEDFRAELVECLLRFFGYPKIYRLAGDIYADLENALASLENYFILLHHANTWGTGATTTVVTKEIEYAIANHRALHDRLNEIVLTLMTTFHPAAPTMPNSFARVLEAKNGPRQKYELPPLVCDYYLQRSKPFLLLRRLRDDIMHRGYSTGSEPIFYTQDGFALFVEGRFAKRFSELSIWPDQLLKPNGLASILALIEFIVSDMIASMGQLSIAICDSFPKPSAAIPAGFHVYMRSPLARHIHMLQTYRNTHWLSPVDVLPLKSTTEAS